MKKFSNAKEAFEAFMAAGPTKVRDAEDAGLAGLEGQGYEADDGQHWIIADVTEDAIHLQVFAADEPICDEGQWFVFKLENCN